MKKKMYKAGVIGLGVGMHHIKAIQKHPNYTVKKVFDFDKTKITKFKKKNPNITIVKSEDDIFNDKEISLVSLASYDNYHYPQIIKSIKKKKHVIVEKPICLTRQELKKIFDKLKKSKIKITSNLVLRTTSIFQQIKSKINKNKVIAIEADYIWGRKHKLYGWRSKIKNYSIIYGCAIHVIDLILWFLKERPVSVYAVGNNLGVNKKKFKNKAYVLIILKFRKGTSVKITANASSIYPHFHELKVFTDKNTIIHNLQGSFELKNKKIKKQLYGYPDKLNRYKIIHSFIDNLENKYKKAIVREEDIFNSMAICFAAEKSIKLKKEIKILYEN